MLVKIVGRMLYEVVHGWAQTNVCSTRHNQVRTDKREYIAKDVIMFHCIRKKSRQRNHPKTGIFRMYSVSVRHKQHPPKRRKQYPKRSILLELELLSPLPPAILGRKAANKMTNLTRESGRLLNLVKTISSWRGRCAPARRQNNGVNSQQTEGTESCARRDNVPFESHGVCASTDFQSSSCRTSLNSGIYAKTKVTTQLLFQSSAKKYIIFFKWKIIIDLSSRQWRTKTEGKATASFDGSFPPTSWKHTREKQLQPAK